MCDLFTKDHGNIKQRHNWVLVIIPYEQSKETIMRDYEGTCVYTVDKFIDFQKAFDTAEPKTY